MTPTIEQQIARFDIAMDHAHLVSVIECLGGLPAQPSHSDHVRPAIPRQISQSRFVAPRLFNASDGLVHRRDARRSPRRALPSPLVKEQFRQTYAVNELHRVKRRTS